MPEGDTIFRTAARLRPALEGRVISAAQSRESAIEADGLPGRQLGVIEARGKHLLMHLDDGRVIHSHMGMTGSWHLYAVGEVWQKPMRRAALVLHVPECVGVCFSPKLLELLSTTQLRRHRYLQRLGPDLLAGPVDEKGVPTRFRLHDKLPIGEAVMNQTIVSGIGNVYKSEILFLARTNPFTRVERLEDRKIVEIVLKSQDWMKKNLQGYPRRTRNSLDGQRLWVYGRRGKPCLRCATRIEMRRQGDQGRTSFWCPRCQATGT